MFRDSFTSKVRRSSTSQRRILLAALLTIVFVLSIVAVELRLPGSATAPWWPAAGVAVIAVLSSRGRGFAVVGLIFVVTAVANLVVGTIWWMALGFAVANAAEALIVVALLRFRRAGSRAFGPGDIVRFLLATAVGGAVIGLLAGLTVFLSGGGMFDTALHVAASHASAGLLITALGILPRRAFTVQPPLVFALQVLGLTAALAVTFAPDQQFPLAFLPIPALAWAAFRFGSGVVLIEIGLTGVAVLGLSLAGHGPFVPPAEGDPVLLVALVQVYVASLIVSLLPLAVVQNVQSALLSRLRTQEQLLRGVIVNANAGFVLVRQEGREFSIIESNPNGMRLLAPWVRDSRDGPTLDSAELGAVLPPSPTEDWTGERELAEGIHLELVVTTVSGTRDVLLVQAIDATEQRMASRALTDALDFERQASERLRDLSTQKDEFVSSVSHELRTPVTSILGYAEELSEADLDATGRHHVDVILRNSRRLAELVDDLLRLARMGAQLQAKPVPVDLSSVIGELTAAARAAGISLTVDLPSDVRVMGDTVAIDRIVTSLVANSLKFTPEGGSVTVSAATTDSGTVRLEVADTGCGIPRDQLEKVFERFYRIADPERSFVPGTGLGLTIVRDLVNGMGGTVTLESDGRQGTTAVVELPAAAVVTG